MTRRIGLLGGSFDPVHKGHVQIAKYSLKKLKLDELWFIPVLKIVKWPVVLIAVPCWNV